LILSDDLRLELRPDFGQGLGKQRALRSPIGEQLCQQRKAGRERGEQQNPSVTILKVGGMNARVDHEPQRID
jgi:hypothetical protein